MRPMYQWFPFFDLLPYFNAQRCLCSIKANSLSHLGDFSEGGNVIIRLFERQYAIKNGGVMLLRASIIEHFVSAYEGQRYSFVHAMAENLSNLQDAKPAKLRGPGNKRVAVDSDVKDNDEGDDIEIRKMARSAATTAGSDSAA